MSLIAKRKTSVDFPVVDAGTYAAVCIGVVDLGNQYNETHKKYEDKILFIWELAGVTYTVGEEVKPRWMQKDYTLSLGEKANLYKILVPWRGKAFTDEELVGNGFSVSDMLGQGCLLQLTVEDKSGKQFNRINGVMGLLSGMAAPEPQSPFMVFDMDNWDDEALEALPGWVQERIKKSTQYQKLHLPTNVVDFAEEEGPQEGGGEPQHGRAMRAPTDDIPATGGCPI